VFMSSRCLLPLFADDLMSIMHLLCHCVV
jgi:hypothetical protein